MQSAMEMQRMASALDEAMSDNNTTTNNKNTNHALSTREQAHLGEAYEDRDVYEEEDEDDDEEEDDPWLQEQVDKLIAEDANQPRDPLAYKPQLMDEREMRALRCELRASDARLESEGHMREFVPRKPATHMGIMAHGRRMRMRMCTPRPATCNPLGLGSDDEQLRDDGFSTADDHTSPPQAHKIHFAQVLRDELMQCSALQDQYEDTKRLLLDHLDLVCSTKPSERATTTRDEAYKTLEELLAFTAKCVL